MERDAVPRRRRKGKNRSMGKDKQRSKTTGPDNHASGEESPRGASTEQPLLPPKFLHSSASGPSLVDKVMGSESWRGSPKKSLVSRTFTMSDLEALKVDEDGNKIHSPRKRTESPFLSAATRSPFPRGASPSLCSSAPTCDAEDTDSCPDPSTNNYSLLKFLLVELDQGALPATVTSVMQHKKQSEVRNFFSVPFKLEKLLFYGFFVCLDSFLYLFSFFPIRIVASMIAIIGYLFGRCEVSAGQVYEVMRGTIFVLTIIGLCNTIDSSIVYHIIRGQALLKLYVIFNTLEVFDKLCCSFGVDIFDNLYWSVLEGMSPTFESGIRSSSQSQRTPPPSDSASSLFAVSPSLASANSSSTSSASHIPLPGGSLLGYPDAPESSSVPKPSNIPAPPEPPPAPPPSFLLKKRQLKPIIIFIVTLFYVYIHTVVLVCSALTLNVAVNSFSQTLLPLLISNQFVELKGMVFKRCEKGNLFQISCSDIVERFQLAIFIFVIVIQNFADMDWDVNESTVYTALQVVLLIQGSEVLVDWVKHAFISKFNHIPAFAYRQFTDILRYDMLKRFESATVSIENTVPHRIGFLSLPIGCLWVRFLWQFFPSDPLLCFLCFLLIVIMSICLKFFVRMYLVNSCYRHAVTEKDVQGILERPHINPKLAPIERFAMLRGRIF